MFCIMYIGKGRFVEKSHRWWLPTELLYTSNVAPTPINSLLLLNHSEWYDRHLHHELLKCSEFGSHLEFVNVFHRKFVKLCQIVSDLWNCVRCISGRQAPLFYIKNIGKEGCVEKPQLIACWTAARITSRSNTHQLTVADVFTVAIPTIIISSIRWCWWRASACSCPLFYVFSSVLPTSRLRWLW